MSLRELGAHQLKDFDQPERLVQLVIEGLANDFPALASLDVRVALPREATSFVGRRQEIDEVTRLLTTSRLLTLTGPGGTGKTRLAIRIAAEVRDGFRDGVQFVDLSALADATLVGPTIARSLGLREDASRSMTESLKDHLRPRHMLLVLDNLERLLPAAGLIEELLADSAGLRVLATSRSALHVYGEQEFPVPPLALPAADERLDQDTMARFAAIALFIDRAQAVKPAFVLSPENAAAVADICLRLDGLPLAIELVASRVRMLEPAEILIRLLDRLPVMGAGGSGVPARQRTLQGAIDWSYDLLTGQEQALFARLAVFSGGCTWSPHDEVSHPDGELGLDTFDGIASLVDRSLLRQAADSGRSRFQMLQTIRDYGLDRLTIEEYRRRPSDVALCHFRDARRDRRGALPGTGPRRVARPFRGRGRQRPGHAGTIIGVRRLRDRPAAGVGDLALLAAARVPARGSYLARDAPRDGARLFAGDPGQGVHGTRRIDLLAVGCRSHRARLRGRGTAAPRFGRPRRRGSGDVRPGVRARHAR